MSFVLPMLSVVIESFCLSGRDRSLREVLYILGFPSVHHFPNLKDALGSDCLFFAFLPCLSISHCCVDVFICTLCVVVISTVSKVVIGSPGSQRLTATCP